jgi:hypothetical protein
MGSPVACDLIFNIRKVYQRYSETHSGFTFPAAYHTIAGLCKAIQELRDKGKPVRPSPGSGGSPPVSNFLIFNLDLHSFLPASIFSVNLVRTAPKQTLKTLLSLMVTQPISPAMTLLTRYFFSFLVNKINYLLTTIFQAMSIDDDALASDIRTDPGIGARETTPDSPKRRTTMENLKVSSPSSSSCSLLSCTLVDRLLGCQESRGHSPSLSCSPWHGY